MATRTYTMASTRWHEITTIWKDNRWLFVVAGWFLGILTFPMLQTVSANFREMAISLVPEAIGIIFTVLILDRLAENRAREQLQTRLVHEARSQSNETAKAAVDWMNAEGWLKRESRTALLRGMNLNNAKLGDADLRSANLQQTDFWRANLTHAHLRYADLRGANFTDANLRDVHLRYATLQQATLTHTDLQHAYLEYANLQQAQLEKANLKAATLFCANLRDAHLDDAIFDEKTVLPDAQRLQDADGNFLKDESDDYIYDKYWTSTTDMQRYTNPQHPDFWQPHYLVAGYTAPDKPWWV